MRIFIFIAFLTKASLCEEDKELSELLKEKSMILAKLDKVINKEIDSFKDIQHVNNLNKHEKQILDLRTLVEKMKEGYEKRSGNDTGLPSKMFRRQMLASAPSTDMPSMTPQIVAATPPLFVDFVEGHRESIKFNGKIKDVYIKKEDFDRPVHNALNKHRWFFSDLSDASNSGSSTAKPYEWENCPKWGKTSSDNVYPCCRKCCKKSMLGCLKRK